MKKKLIKKNIDKHKKFYPVLKTKELEDDKVLITTGLVDNKLNIIIPFRKEIISYDDYISDKNHIHIICFNNDKAVYEFMDGKYYVINLNNVKFKKVKNDFIPLNPIKQLYGLSVIDNENIIELSLQGCRVYNVSYDKYMSLNYDYIYFSKKYENYYDATYFLYENEYSNPLVVQLLLDNNFNINNSVIINGEFSLYLSDEVLKNEKYLKSYCDSAYNDYYENIMKKSSKRRYIN